MRFASTPAPCPKQQQADEPGEDLPLGTYAPAAATAIYIFFDVATGVGTGVRAAGGIGGRVRLSLVTAARVQARIVVARVRSGVPVPG